MLMLREQDKTHVEIAQITGYIPARTSRQCLSA